MRNNVQATAAMLAKTADTAAIRRQLNQQLQGEARGTLLNLALAGLGTGAGLRGLQGLVSLGRRNLSPPPKPTRPGPLLAEVPYPVEEEEEPAPRKQAGLSEFTRGDYASSVTGMPWFLPAALAATAGGAYGGYRGVDYLLDRRRQSDQKLDLANARQRFREALINRHRPVEDDEEDPVKQADDGAAALDQLFDHVARSGQVKTSLDLGNLAGQAAGLYGWYALPTAALGGAWAFNKKRGRQRHALIEQARKERLRRNYNNRPPQIVAVPAPVSIPRKPEPKEEEEPEQAEGQTETGDSGESGSRRRIIHLEP